MLLLRLVCWVGFGLVWFGLVWFGLGAWRVGLGFGAKRGLWSFGDGGGGSGWIRLVAFY